MLTGKNLIDGKWADSNTSNENFDLDGIVFYQASKNQVELACLAARRDFRDYSYQSNKGRAEFLRTIAAQIDILGDEITKTAMLETGLPEARLVGERGRTTAQLKMFATLIEQDKYLDIRVDKALPDRIPVPRPDIRLTQRAIGPVVVFGASNFPLAFSTCGGDTASALAVGCPVIVKGHSAHAGTAELVGQAIFNAIEKCNMPKATFQMLQGSGRVIGSALVNHPEINAVGFTGSLSGGRTLYDQCHSRKKPIPFYGELGSINPMFCLENAMSSRAYEIATGWVTSLTMGAGQFCTNPGVVVMVKGAAAQEFENATKNALKNSVEQKMLTDIICASLNDGVEAFSKQIEPVYLDGHICSDRCALPAVFKVDAKIWLESEVLQEEVFGALGVLIICDDKQEMLQLAENLEGQLTTTLFLNEADEVFAHKLLPILEEKSGRILCNGYPTGVEVCDAMMHGGPYPASTDSRVSSIGTIAITRWLRPLAYQNFPSNLLHCEIR
ncbi:MAG: aldehyde dehydrogenase (NADP(+)) [Rhizobiales bacterium]|nr:aldehyde dehydrogenase (NADP(+)) [Hyphomicrobiales bacterium]